MCVSKKNRAYGLGHGATKADLQGIETLFTFDFHIKIGDFASIFSENQGFSALKMRNS